MSLTVGRNIKQSISTDTFQLMLLCMTFHIVTGLQQYREVQSSPLLEPPPHFCPSSASWPWSHPALSSPPAMDDENRMSIRQAGTTSKRISQSVWKESNTSVGLATDFSSTYLAQGPRKLSISSASPPLTFFLFSGFLCPLSKTVSPGIRNQKKNFKIRGTKSFCESWKYHPNI